MNLEAAIANLESHGYTVRRDAADQWWIYRADEASGDVYFGEDEVIQFSAEVAADEDQAAGAAVTPGADTAEDTGALNIEGPPPEWWRQTGMAQWPPMRVLDEYGTESIDYDAIWSAYDRFGKPKPQDERFLGMVDEDGWQFDQYGYTDVDGTPVITRRTPRPGGDMNIDQRISRLLSQVEDIGDPNDENLQRAQAFFDFKNQPTKADRLQTALQIAQSPSDYMTLVGLYTGALKMEDPIGYGERIAPLAPFLQGVARQFFMDVPGITEPVKTEQELEQDVQMALSEDRTRLGEPEKTEAEKAAEAAETAAIDESPDVQAWRKQTQDPERVQEAIDQGFPGWLGDPHGILEGEFLDEQGVPRVIDADAPIDVQEKNRRAMEGFKVISDPKARDGYWQAEALQAINNGGVWDPVTREVVGGTVPVQKIPSLPQESKFEWGHLATPGEKYEDLSPFGVPAGYVPPMPGELQGRGGTIRGFQMPESPGQYFQERLREEAGQVKQQDPQQVFVPSATGRGGRMVEIEEDYGYGGDFDQGGVVPGFPGDKKLITAEAGEVILPNDPTVRNQMLQKTGMFGPVLRPPPGEEITTLTRPMLGSMPRRGMSQLGFRFRSPQTMRGMTPSQRAMYQAEIEKLGFPYSDYSAIEQKAAGLSGRRMPSLRFRSPGRMRG